MLKLFRLLLGFISFYLFIVFSMNIISIYEHGIDHINSKLLMIIMSCQLFLIEGRNIINYFIIRSLPEDAIKDREIARLIILLRENPEDEKIKDRLLTLGYRPLVKNVVKNNLPIHYENGYRIIRLYDPHIDIDSIKLFMSGILQKHTVDYRIIGDRLFLDTLVNFDDNLELHYTTYQYL